MTIVERPGEPIWTPISGEHVAASADPTWDRNDWQRVWLRTQRLDWRILALVPGDDRVSTLDVANVIARLAFDHGEVLRVADARALRPKHVDAFLDGCRWEASQGTRIVFATRPAASNVATVPVARAADGAIMCVSVGSTAMKDIRSSVDEIGKEYFLGSLLIEASSTRANAP